MTVYYPLLGKEIVRVTLDYAPYRGMIWTMKLQDGTTIADCFDRGNLLRYAERKQATIEKQCNTVAHWDSPQYNCPECANNS